jgi:L-fuconolactonase
VSAAAIDAHQHFWRRSCGDYGWLTPDLEVLYRDFEPADLLPLMEGAGVERTIVVQAAPSVAETRFLLRLADDTEWIAGVVGWIDMASRDATEVLDALAAHQALRGVRPMIQDIPDPDWMLGDGLTPAFEALERRGQSFDALVKPWHLPRLLSLLERHPSLTVVVDHAAKPDIAGGGFETWARDISLIARNTAACCKLSGLVTEATSDWDDAALRPYVDHLLGCFSPERLLWGSDWPVVELAGGYAAWREASLRLLAGVTAHERDAILGGNAARIYQLDCEG